MLAHFSSLDKRCRYDSNGPVHRYSLAISEYGRIGDGGVFGGRGAAAERIPRESGGCDDQGAGTTGNGVQSNA